MAQEKENAKKQAETVMPHEDVVVEYTDKAFFHTKGDKEAVHRLLAEKLVAKGVAKIVNK
jgi:hypothetical protein